MRLHLVISRHGLPATRILWTTTSSTSVLGEYGTRRAASAAAVASSRTPNIAFSNGGYTVAQLLEDVNEVVPLETEPNLFDAEFSGQWGLEDYVVEVAGSECLHFMEVEGLFRDGDEVVIRALQLADLRARRLCGRHQIAADGKHLIDGVPFGSPFLKRTSSTRPAITIPPRKKRRTVFSGWDHVPEIQNDEANADEEEDGDWLPPTDTGFGKELSIMPAEHEESMGTVIRHPIDHSVETDSEAALSELEEDELESELQALKEDFEEPSQFVDIRNQTRTASGNPLRAASTTKRPTSSDSLHKGSLLAPSSLSSKRSRADDSSPRTSKAVRFNKGDDNLPGIPQPQAPETIAVSSDSESAMSSSSSDSDSDDSSSSEEELSKPDALPDADSSSSSSDSSSDSDSDSDSESDSDAEEEEKEEEIPPPPEKVQPPVVVGPPFQGSMRTKKSNNRFKLRRRLSKLKEMGALHKDANFEELREWEENNGGWYVPKSTDVAQPIQYLEESTKKQKKEEEKRDFEAKRQKLLRDLASGNGINVDETSEKENVPPYAPSRASDVAAPVAVTEEPEEEPEKASSRRTLDIASSRRMLFGSLGMRTPKTKKDEEETRRKLAAKFSAIGKKPAPVSQEQAEEVEVGEDESDGDWQNKLVVRAVECVYPEIKLTAPPYPFVQRWDQEANALIRQAKGTNKKRKRKQRVQVYDGAEEYDEGNEDYHGYEGYDGYYQGGNDSYWPGEGDGDDQLNYDDAEAEPAETADTPEDLPELPNDVNTVPVLNEKELKKGAIIAFRQLEMSKDTNWQPRMSEYRVAEVIESPNEEGTISVRLAKRDRRPAPELSEDDYDGPRQYDKFEMPGFEDDEGEDDGHREVSFSELNYPKLLQAAAHSGAESGNQNNAREGSIVSVVAESVPNAQVPLPPDMDVDINVDETTFVTIGNEVSHIQSPRRSPGLPVESPAMETLDEVTVPQIQVQNGSDERSVTPPIPSPSFTGFHSARSWQPATPGLIVTAENGNLEGHTLLGSETPSALANPEEDPSYLSFLSANQSFANTSMDLEEEPESEQEQGQEQDRQIVNDNPMPPAESGGSGPQSGSLLSTIGMSGDGAGDSLVAINSTVGDHDIGPTSSAQSWKDLLNSLGRSPLNSEEEDVNEEYGSDEDEDEGENNNDVVEEEEEEEEGDGHDDEDKDEDGPSLQENHGADGSHDQMQDSMEPSNHELYLGYESPSPFRSSSPKPPPSAQKEAEQKPEQSFPSLQTEPPAASTRLKLSQRSRGSGSASQIPASQKSEVIDLTSSTHATPEPEPEPENSGAQSQSQSQSQSQRSKSERFKEPKGDISGSLGRKTRASTGTGRLQQMTEVSISPSRKKRRSSRKF